MNTLWKLLSYYKYLIVVVVGVLVVGIVDENSFAKRVQYELDHTDRRMLETMVMKFGGGPVGLDTLAAATSEERDTIEDVYEPYLLQLGFINRTPKGRVVTRAGYEHMNIPYPEA